MIDLKDRIEAFEQLAVKLLKEKYGELNELQKLQNIVLTAQHKNPWFTRENVKQALTAIGASISGGRLEKWIEPYQTNINAIASKKTVAVINAGNIPAVGFHDFLSVVITGHKYLGKLSSDDKDILPELARILIQFQPELKSQISFTTDRVKDFDAVIATGSNNTSRYFEYYFGKYPNIIRKNRNGVACLTGYETNAELKSLGKDVFSYFGLGCRSVSKLYLPRGYQFDKFFEALESFKHAVDVFKYKNNYDYYKSIYLVNRVQHYDNGFVILTEESAISSPPAVLFYEFYDSVEQLDSILENRKEEIQCFIGNRSDVNWIPFGNAQSPNLWDYADDVDTMEFLISL